MLIRTTSPALRSLSHLEDLDEAIRQSYERPVVLFKHSSTCGTSAYAYERISQWLARSRPPVDVFLVDVHLARALARAISTRLRVRHESPQVILMRNGVVEWHTSHSMITPEALDREVQRASASPAP